MPIDPTTITDATGLLNYLAEQAQAQAANPYNHHNAIKGYIPDQYNEVKNQVTNEARVRWSRHLPNNRTDISYYIAQLQPTGNDMVAVFQAAAADLS